jgi:uncharacterized Fe-S cluster protein YjdI
MMDAKRDPWKDPQKVGKTEKQKVVQKELTLAVKKV